MRNELDAAAEAQKAAEDKAKGRHRGAPPVCAGRLGELPSPHRQRAYRRARARDRKLVTALLPVVDDIERAIDHARSQGLPTTLSSSSMALTRYMPSCSTCLRMRALSPIDPRARRSIRSSTRPWAASRTHRNYDETVNDVYQKGYRMADAFCGPAMGR